MAEPKNTLDRKAQELMEKTESDSRTRAYSGIMDHVLTGSLGAVRLRAAHIMILLPLAFLLYPTWRTERRKRRFPPFWDVVLCIAAVCCFAYILRRYDALAKTGRLNDTDVRVGIICLIVCFEAARRTSGNLAVIALVFLSYFALWGRYIPGTFGTAAFTLKRVIKSLVWDTIGILGTGSGVSATYIFIFILFGSFLKYSGFSQFINDISLTLVGRYHHPADEENRVSEGLRRGG